MRSTGIEPTLQSYNHAFKAWSKMGEVQAVEALMEKMQQRGFVPNIVSWTNLVMAHTIRGDLDGAMKVVERMRAAGVMPNFVTYTLLVDANGKKGDMQQVQALLLELEGDSSSVDMAQRLSSPYSSAMSHYLKLGDLEAAACMWDRIHERQLTPDTTAFAVFFQLCCLRGNMHPAERAFDEMVANRVRVNGYCFVPFFKHYAKEGKVVDCQAWWQKMEDLRCRPSTSCYNSMIMVFSKAGMTETAETWMTRVENSSEGPNGHSFGSLMDAYARHGRTAECRELLERMRRRRVPENRVHLNTLIKAHVNADDLEGAERVLSEMGQIKGCEPDSVSYSTVMFGLLKRRRDVKRADELLEQMRAAGLAPDTVVAGALENARNVALGADQQDAAAAAPVAAAAPAAPAATLPGVDWVEELGADGSRTFLRAATGERTAEEPSAGVVQLTSEHGPYFWHVESGTTSWDAPGASADWPPRAAA